MSGGIARSAEHAETESHTVPDVDHRLIFEKVSAPCAVLLPDAPRFSIVSVSEAYLAVTGATRASSLGFGLLDAAQRRPYLLGEDQFDRLRSAIERAILTRAASRLLLEGKPASDLLRDAGSQGGAPGGVRQRWAIVNTPVVGPGGEVLYLLHRVEAVGRGPHDSGERERTRGLEQTLDERTRSLESARAELEALSYSVSHDLRAPLRAIDGFSQALCQDYAGVLDERAQHYLDRISAGAQRMSALIDDMLELSRLQRVPLRRSPVDVSSLARRILDALMREHPTRRVEVEIAPNLLVDADSHLIGVLLEKLLDNAWKFTTKKESAHIVVGREPGAATSTLFVADDGVGFDMAYAGRLFSPFQRLHKASEFDGNGIGLAAAQRIVSRHGGRIWAEAQPGGGATFRFYVGAGDE